MKKELPKSKDEFLKLAVEIHGKKYNYDDINYISLYDLVDIKCEIHGFFKQKPYNHINYRGCKKCNNHKSNREEFIEKANKKHNNKYDYSKVIYEKAIKKIEIICKEHGSFFMSCYRHLSGFGCRKCKKLEPKIHYNKDNFIKIATEIHENKYKYNKNSFIFKNKTLKIKCPIHGFFWQTPKSHIEYKRGCEKCGHQNKKKTQKEFLNKCKEIYGENVYDYSKAIYVGVNKKVEIKCLKHNHYFKQKPKDHYDSQGCGLCASENWSDNSRIKLNDFLKQAIEVHSKKYSYNFVTERSLRNSKIKIQCNSCFTIFEQEFSVHLKGSGCKKCVFDSFRLGKEEFIKRSKEKFKDKNLDYSLVNYINSNTKIEIMCQKHGLFKQTPKNHLEGTGCPRCSISCVSAIEIRWLDYLNIPKQYVQKIVEINGNKYKVDAYDENSNTVYEFLGDFWHGNPNKYKPNEINKINKKTFGELYQKTVERIKTFELNGYKVIYIWESDFRKIEKENKKNENKE